MPSELQKTGRESLYWRKGGIYWPAIIAQVVGMFAAISALYVNPTYYFRVPRWMNEVTDHTQDASHFGGDFSIFLGMGVAALVYLVLAARTVRKEADAQDVLLEEEGLLDRSEPGLAQPQSSTRPPSAVGVEEGHGTEGADQCRVLAQRGLPRAALGHQGPDDHRLGVHAADEAQGRRRATRRWR